eukprot:GHVS01084455.1.p2 GENE.GHVS01084455.1~~GHVS01084455.1.p2  ORF type:complete len:106 (-),score=6.32 GHVS01084455.1:35-352(-)
MDRSMATVFVLQILEAAVHQNNQPDGFAGHLELCQPTIENDYDVTECYERLKIPPSDGASFDYANYLRLRNGPCFPFTNNVEGLFPYTLIFHQLGPGVAMPVERA